MLCVADDGTGFAGEIGSGNGLMNMRERAEGLGGRFAVDAPPAGGTTLEWRVPVRAPSNAG